MPKPALPAGGAPAVTADHARLLASPRLRVMLAALAGALLAAAFAPLNLWPLGVLAPAVLMWLWQEASPREAARLGFAFTTATFIAGTYWLYLSIHVLGQAPIWLALVLMLALASIMGMDYGDGYQHCLHLRDRKYEYDRKGLGNMELYAMVCKRTNRGKE